MPAYETSAEVSAGWVRLAREGDETAARLLVESLYPCVIKIVRAHPQSRNDEEDLAQEIFIKMFKKLSDYRMEVPLEHWVSRIAFTTCMDGLRWQQRRPELRYADLSEEQQILLEETTPENASRHAQQNTAAKQLLEQLLHRLKPAERQVIQWLEVEELSLKDVAQRTGWGLSKVKVTSFRAKNKLRHLLSQIK
jgi:RNA polymerase sigma factor (sigma-70 family)